MEWLTLNPSDFAAKTRHDADVQIRYSVSPYDVPEAVRGDFSPTAQRFLIEFKYLQSEKKLVNLTDPDVKEITLRVGRDTGRVYLIEVDVEKLKAKSVALSMVVGKVEQALDRFQHSSRSHRDENVRVTQEVINRLGNRLLAPAAG